MHFFITGTDTDVGKTVVAGTLIKHLKQSGKKVSYYKPLQTGAIEKNRKLISEDVETVNLISVSNFDSRQNCEYLLKAPMSPFQAAKKENTKIHMQHVFTKYYQLVATSDSVIVEGAGGVLVPITEEYVMLNMIKSLGIPVIIVARPGLGTINHTLLTINELEAAGITMKGFIFGNYPKNPDMVVQENPEMIERYGKIPFLGQVQQVKNLSNAVLTLTHTGLSTFK